MKSRISVALLGIEKAGKSALMNRICHNAFTTTYSCTIGVDYFTLPDDIGRVWDLSGQEKFIEITKGYLSESDYCCFVFDPTQDLDLQKEFFTKYLECLNKDKCYIFIITKADLVLSAQLETFKQNLEPYKKVLASQFQVDSQTHITSSGNENDPGIEAFKDFLKTSKAKKLQAALDAASNAKNPYELFNHLSYNYALEKQDEDHEKALRIFNEEVAKINNDLDKISALVKAAEDFINRHKNPRFDNFFGKKNTESWKKCLKLAREAGLQTLSRQLDNHSITKENVEAWRNHSLFASHRNNSIFKGAFGRTKSQVEIDRLVSHHIFRV